MRRLLRNTEREVDPCPSGEISCEEALARVLEWLDGEMDPEDAAAVGAHLEICGRCHPRLQFERAFREAMARAAALERRTVVRNDLRRGITSGLGSQGLDGEQL